ncbi:hypothetical protein chiPu_0007156 [Chiloscyllium punctatum]|uniref:Uncharacterized protein n=1 Tax=Chiloscyllium punctatum TaxID=137246 RepID=A0A401SE64_CHIPU|nr:hypothetical protein [Chiloscyllium punctatum]
MAKQHCRACSSCQTNRRTNEHKSMQTHPSFLQSPATGNIPLFTYVKTKNKVVAPTSKAAAVDTDKVWMKQQLLESEINTSTH